MAFYYGGILEGIMAADAKKAAAEDRRINQERYDREQARADEKFAFSKKKFEFDVANASESNLLKHLKSIGKSNKSNVLNNAELKNLLTTIQKTLPENSSTASKLVNAPVKVLKEAVSIILAAKANAESAGIVWTPELSENLFEDVYTTTVVNENAFDPVALAEQAGIDYEGNASFGIPWKEIIKQYIPDATDTAVTIIPRTPVEPLDLSKQAQLQKSYRESLEGPLNDMKADFNTKIAEGENVDQSLVVKVDKALADLKGDNPSTRLAVQLIGPQVAIDLLTMNPNAQPYRTYINKGLMFSEDAAGEELLARAIRVGLLVEGDKIMLGTRLVPITAATIAAAQEN